ncbi:hemerythrin domain-containing protein [Paenibacillus allorhizosphaerae]|uniref:Hemerythrin-like domain-containing protein n=1 Tax=Paenibacillus allorhizosphaerae TaxID=2849866 RepID=A0ABM8VCZ5_9BACL|nr:hemerythrin domain-containing protein [Paenibacillus allorhizosphaerae]CAG7625893.1 hypothetical protein PAECIP111802_01194 [Paenibacillus allorhizosphaerae]
MTERLSYSFGSGATHVTADPACAFARLRNEHNHLYDVIDCLETMASQLKNVAERNVRRERLKELRDTTLALLAELDEHSDWEDTQLFPFLTEYSQLPIRPVVTTSLWMLEKEQELAAMYFHLFLEETEQIFRNPDPSGIGRCTEQLLQACRLVKSHLQMEEETIYPLMAELPE